MDGLLKNQSYRKRLIDGEVDELVELFGAVKIEGAFRGRNIEIRVWPLSFSEYHSWAAGDVRQDYGDYLLYGGMPYVTSYDTREGKTGYLKMLESTVATRDIVERHKVRNVAAFEAVYDFLCSNVGSVVSASGSAEPQPPDIRSELQKTQFNPLCGWLFSCRPLLSRIPFSTKSFVRAEAGRYGALRWDGAHHGRG